MIPNQTVMDFYQIKSISSLQLNSWGVLEPIGDPDERQDIPKFDAMIIPGLAFHQDKIQLFRLGRGGGYYDKFFEAYVKEYKNLPYTIGVAFDCQIVDENELKLASLDVFPCEDHDFCLDELLSG